MIGETTVQAGGAIVYALIVLVGFWYIQRFSDTARRVGYVAIGVVVVSVIGAVATAAGVLTYEGALEGQQSIPAFFDDVIAYGLLFGLTTWFAGASKRMIGLVAGLSVLSRIAVEAGVMLGETAIAVGLLISVGTYVARLYLLWGPVWTTAQSVSDDRRLLFWKARNLLMFLMGMNIASAALNGAGLVDVFVELLLTEYIDLLLRAGFVGFLLTNLGAISDVDTAELLGDDAQPPGEATTD